MHYYTRVLKLTVNQLRLWHRTHSIHYGNVLKPGLIISYFEAIFFSVTIDKQKALRRDSIYNIENTDL